MKTHVFFSLPLLFIVGTTSGTGCVAQRSDSKIAITTGSQEALSHYLIARDLSEKIRAQESVAYFEKAIAEDADFAMAYLGLALNGGGAKVFFDNIAMAVELQDRVSQGERLQILATEAGGNGDPAKQKQLLLELVAKYPNDERAHNLLGNYHFFTAQEYDLAIASYKEALAINPEFSPPYNSLGYAFRTQEKYDEAAEAFQKYIELIPGDPNPYDSYAELQMKMGKFEESIETYRKALATNPDFVLSHIGIASNLVFKGEHAAASLQLKELYDNAKSDGQRRTAHFGRMVCSVDEGDFGQAIEEVEQRYALAEKTADYAAMAADLNLKGNLLLENEQTDAAKASFEQAMQVVEASNLSQESKENAKRAHLFNIARVALEQGDLETARSKSAEFTEKANERKNAVQIRLAHQLAGLMALAEEDYDAALAELQLSNQQNAYNLYRLAVAYDGLGDVDSAWKMRKRAINFNAVNDLNLAMVRHKSRRMMSAK